MSRTARRRTPTMLAVDAVTARGGFATPAQAVADLKRALGAVPAADAVRLAVAANYLEATTDLTGAEVLTVVAPATATALSVRQVRAQLVYEAIRMHVDRIETVEDVAALPTLNRDPRAGRG